MTEDEVLAFAAGLPGVVVETASEAGGAPQVAWGDSFVYLDPHRDIPTDRRWPFATVVVSDYPGFDEASRLSRDGVFRVNVVVGRERFAELVGYPPSEHGSREPTVDPAALDTLIPHPAYGQQAWVSVLNPDHTDDLVRSLLTEAHERAAARR